MDTSFFFAFIVLRVFSLFLFYPFGQVVRCSLGQPPASERSPVRPQHGPLVFADIRRWDRPLSRVIVISSDEEPEVTTPDSPPAAIVLPQIYRRFTDFIPGLKVVSPTPSNPTPSRQEYQRCEFDLHPDQIIWLEAGPWVISEKGEDFYRSVSVQNQIIRIGSVVRCRRKTGLEFSYRKAKLKTPHPDYGSDTEDEDSGAQDNSPRPNVRRFWVRALFERDQAKYFHGTWLEDATHSFIASAAEPNELFLVQQCYEIDLKFVVAIEDFSWIFKSDSSPLPHDKLFCRFRWSPVHGNWVDLPNNQQVKPVASRIVDSIALCPTCGSIPSEIEWLADPATGQISLGESDRYESLGFILRGKDVYKLNDFVRVSAQNPLDPQEIGQIVEICGVRANPHTEQTILLDEAPFQPAAEVYSKLKASNRKPVITVRLYSRLPWYRSNKYSDDFKDDRRLWLTQKERLVDVKDELQGKCEIVHLVNSKGQGYFTLGTQHRVSVDSILKRENCFYSILPTPKQQSQRCSVPIIGKAWKKAIISQEQEWVKVEYKKKSDVPQEVKLRHLELFGGIGSMSVAFAEVGLALEKKTMFIDLCVSACETIACNFPHCQVICADVNQVLELMVKENPNCDDFLIDQRTGLKLFRSDLPKPGDFDLITAGFPCGSHSTLNAMRKATDAKNALCATTLSFVDYLKPKYILFENVRGLLKTTFSNPTDGLTYDKPFLRLITGTLVSLGYQVQFGVLQAAQFGAPQKRRRIIFTGALHGLTAPTLPEPTHHFPDEALAIPLPKNSFQYEKTVKAGYKKSNSAALKAITIRDAISDLPRFEYQNPHLIIPPATKRQKVEEPIPLINDFLSLHEPKSSLVGFDDIQYLSPPSNNFQVWLRKDLGRRIQSASTSQNEGVVIRRIQNWHVTPKFSAKVVERICNIPFRPGADHEALPQPLKLKPAANNLFNDLDGNYGRLSYDDQFQTIITVSKTLITVLLICWKKKNCGLIFAYIYKTMNPRNQGKCGMVLHPDQSRTYTVLEAQRAQGFPDWYRLEPGPSNLKNNCSSRLFRLVGNAIPIPICLGLARSLLRAIEIDRNRSTGLLDDEIRPVEVIDLMD
ncbi:hypothetical protein O181_008238 [Austropuccinia psidii MF-1]|uniref:DNA (cytosine-5-)-methyltransferase n=1 Tax=Austropuccinia psidii MF-1 TaxID=1389203 RepID=A0A9Q3BP05_9BASI|nr:hypothetical protein [Austropuccinia psidii MF-1]